ncbi:glycosyltransferase family 4 protein [Parafilimonas terrae]|uniref:Glycosyltransferase involved in cell wall bisynthesis n=1 Tax=Parafilimonas terrae TaxID=1465490 RepID=A0A1I5UER0_9BACT|nr:glycosyltransferase family 4 protein [Parafilimonas terrae]SFP93770.1 Glycosyltransferase involved in cell wall bisynthesis [Parafilimonas terrae]
MTYKTAVIKTTVERIIMFPFVLLGKLMHPFFFIKEKHGFIIFAPSADIGGSTQVNIDLCLCFAHKKPLVIFSKKPKNNQYLQQFKNTGARTIDLHRYIDNKLYHFINFFYRGVIAGYINKIDKPVVVGGESLFFYKVAPFIKKDALCADICHLNTWFNYTQGLIKFLDARIFSTKKIMKDAEAIYTNNNLREEYFSRLHFIDNAIDIPPYKKISNKVLSVVYIGRGAPQKRVYLIAAIAKKMHESNMNIHFSFVGDVEKIFNPADYPFCTFYGNINDKNKMEEVYNNSDVLLLTSAYEGLPIVVMQMMAHGKVVVSTAVDAIPDYITDEENGFLLINDPDENKIVTEGVSILSKLVNNPALLEEVGNKSRQYAEKHFSRETFCKEYARVLFNK